MPGPAPGRLATIDKPSFFVVWRERSGWRELVWCGVRSPAEFRFMEGLRAGDRVEEAAYTSKTREVRMVSWTVTQDGSFVPTPEDKYPPDIWKD